MPFVGLVVAAVAGEDKGFVGIAESLGNHGHNHGNLHPCAIDSQLYLAFLAGHDVLEDNLVGRLVEDAGNAEYQDGPCIGEHAAEQGEVNLPAQAEDFAPESQRDDSRAEEVDIEDMPYGGRPSGYHVRQDEEEDEVQRDVECDESGFQYGKPHGAFLIPEISEWDGLEGIECHHACHGHHIFGMCGIAHGSADGRQCQPHDGKEAQAHGSHGKEGGGVYALGIVLVGTVDEPEERSLHAEGEDDEEESRIAVDFSDYAITSACCRNPRSVERYKKVVEEAAYDAAQSVDGSVLGQGF